MPRLTFLSAKEDQVHQSVHDALCTLIAPPGVASQDGVVWWTVEHRAYGAIQGAQRKRRGVVRGIPDLHFYHNGRCLLVELKRGPKETFSQSQKELRGALAKAGVPVELAHSIHGVLGALSAHGIPHRQAAV